MRKIGKFLARLLKWRSFPGIIRHVIRGIRLKFAGLLGILTKENNDVCDCCSLSCPCVRFFA